MAGSDFRRSAVAVGAVMLALAAASCATTPTLPSDAVPAAPTRQFAYQQATPELSATLVATRDSGTFGGGCRIAVFVDGTKAASLGAGETATLHVPPGERVLKAAKDGSGICWPDPGNFNERETTVGKGQTKLFRVTFDLNGRPDIQRTGP